jgi:DNA-binding NarL/FixJ family response regulator
MEVVGQAANGLEAIALASGARAAVIVMDVRKPELDGIEATRAIAADDGLAGARILGLTTYDDDENVLAALRAGASGFLVKDTRPADLLDAIRTVAAGDSLLSPGPTARLIARVLRLPDRPPAGTPAPAGLAGLSEREREVLTLTARGFTSQEIGTRLALSPRTVETYRERLMAKLGLTHRSELVDYALRHHLLEH